jgi:hypothetical protein
MNRRLVPFTILFLALMAILTVTKAADQTDLAVHEWGTFTSIAGENGEAISWRPFGGPADLPCFVDRFRTFKGDMLGTVRMETPVLYFYGSRESTASVKVRFPRGVITEWYPKAAMSNTNNVLEWRSFKVAPNSAPAFPVERGESHYYTARKTDAAPLQVGTQHEKFLFYRGVGTFPLPLSAKTMPGERVLVKNLGTEDVRDLVLFENRGGKLRYRIAESLRNEITFEWSSSPAGTLALQADLERILVARGLYPKEARAMIETWRDSWFEEGTRLFYIVPSGTIDSVLPLDIQPAPVQTARVFVGRMEIITPAIQDEVKNAITTNYRRTLEKYGRFLEPIAKRIGAKSALLDAVYSSYVSRASGCNS